MNNGPAQKRHTGPVLTMTSEDLLRISVGLEHPQDLIDDLRQALEGGR
jgi:cystathionine beta-lyase/cystathionine gamma-synthase